MNRIIKVLIFLSLKIFNKIEKKNDICINVFCYENNLIYPAYISNEKFKNYVDLLLIIDGNKSYYILILSINIMY